MMPMQVIDRLFSRLQGVYGTTFTSKFSTGIGRDGIDPGFENAKSVWADELSGFADNLDAIAYALRNTDPKFPPSAREFVSLCRTAPKKDQPASLEYRPSAEDWDRHREMSRDAVAAVTKKNYDGLLWAKKPKSHKAAEMIFDAKKKASRYPALAAIFDKHVIDGVMDEAGKLLSRWDGVAWVKANG